MVLRAGSGALRWAAVVTSRPGPVVAAARGGGGVVPVGVGVVRVLRYPAVCICGAALAAGTSAVWERVTRRVWCRPCADSEASPPAAGPGAVVSAGEGAGASLQRTYEARRADRAARVRAAHPRVGGLLVAVTAEPATTTAFARGAAGERRLAGELERACGDRVLFLHNRRLGPARRDGDLDHVAVCPGGVVVIDAKHLTAARVSVRTTGGLFTPSRAQLRVSGRDGTAHIAGSIRQQGAVTAALAADDHMTGAGGVGVTGVLCFLDATIEGWRWRPPRVDGVHVTSPTGLIRLLRRPGPLDAATRRSIYDHLAAHLPPA